MSRLARDVTVVPGILVAFLFNLLSNAGMPFLQDILSFLNLNDLHKDRGLVTPAY